MALTLHPIWQGTDAAPNMTDDNWRHNVGYVADVTDLEIAAGGVT